MVILSTRGIMHQICSCYSRATSSDKIVIVKWQQIGVVWIWTSTLNKYLFYKHPNNLKLV